MKLSFFTHLTKQEQHNYINIYFEAFKVGGPIKYLNFDNIEYVESLRNGNSLPDGNNALIHLLMFKFTKKVNFHDN